MQKDKPKSSLEKVSIILEEGARKGRRRRSDASYRSSLPSFDHLLSLHLRLFDGRRLGFIEVHAFKVSRGAKSEKI